MELQNMDLRGGSLQISTEVLGKIARCAALEVAGVAEVSCGSQNRKVKDFKFIFYFPVFYVYVLTTHIYGKIIFL